MSDTLQRPSPPLDPAHNLRNARRWLGWLGALCALGCSSQVTPEYEGEPMAVLQGALAAQGDFEMPSDDGMTVGLVWLVGSPGGERQPLVAEVAQTEGQFPFGFEITVHGPPKAEAQTLLCSAPPCDDPEPQPYYQGFVAAIASGTDLDRTQPTDILGAALDHGVLYFERDANPDDASDPVGIMAAAYNVPARRGYHLYRIDKDDQLYAEVRRCSYNGLCVHRRLSHDPARQYFADQSVQECLELVPDAETCTEYPLWCPSDATTASDCGTYFDEVGAEPGAAELAEHERCQALQEQHAPPDDCGALARPWQHPPNPLGFDAEISIRMGAGLYEWMN